MPHTPHRTALLLAALATLSACSTSSSPRLPQPPPVMATASLPLPSPTHSTPTDLPGLHNLVAFHQGLISGSQPEGLPAFDSLASLGVKTIISVDGAQPDVQLAAQRGIRYIHLPISYSGIDPDRQLQLARATRDALRQGPVYIHCHHGKHRSAAAAATVTTILGLSSADQGLARMKVSGTAPNYTGLFACVREASPLPESAINAVPDDFPSISKPSDIVQAMVDIDLAFEHLKDIEAAGWKTPPQNPDLVPASEAGRLADLYRHLLEPHNASRHPADMTPLLQDAHRHASILESLFAANQPDPGKLSAQLKLIAASCKDCHAKYRD